MHMDGSVIPWFQMLCKANQLLTWDALTMAIELQFGPSQFECPRAKLFKLAQHDSVNDYYKEFMALANRVEGISEAALLDCFISGLKSEIKHEVIAQSPSSLLHAASLARLFDEKHLEGFSNAKHRPTASVSHSLPATASKFPWKLIGATTPTSTSSVSKPPLPALLPTPTTRPLPSIKKMSIAEMQIRRDNGLCFTCDEKFSWNHRCPNLQYLLFHVDDDEPPDDSAVILPSDPDASTYLLML